MTPRDATPDAAPADGPDARPPVKLTDPRAIRALAHPARLKVIEELYTGRELTATECAEIGGLSPSAMSYHLRSLEKAGIVERAAPTGDNRERPWRAAGSYVQVDARDGAGQLAAANALSSTVMGRTIEQFEAWQARRHREPPEWRDAGGTSFGQLWLTAAEATELEEQMTELFTRFRGRRTGERPAGSRRVRVSVAVFPTDDPDGAKPEVGSQG